MYLHVYVYIKIIYNLYKILMYKYNTFLLIFTYSNLVHHKSKYKEINDGMDFFLCDLYNKNWNLNFNKNCRNVIVSKVKKHPWKKTLLYLNVLVFD